MHRAGIGKIAMKRWGHSAICAGNPSLTRLSDNRPMIPMRNSTIFKSRWMALLWAAGIIWLAFQVAGPDDASANSDANATDATGAPLTVQDEKALEEAINSI
jgi:hypothetical protein